MPGDAFLKKVRIRILDILLRLETCYIEGHHVAVALKGRKEDVSYAQILKKAKEEISLNELGIENSRIRKEINGDIIIEKVS